MYLKFFQFHHLKWWLFFAKGYKTKKSARAVPTFFGHRFVSIADAITSSIPIAESTVNFSLKMRTSLASVSGMLKM